MKERRLLIFLAVAIAILVTRGVLFSPGWVEHSADFTVHIDREKELQSWSGAWNAYLGDDNSAVLSQAPVSLLLLQVMGTAESQKILLFLVYLLMALAMGLTMYAWIKEFDARRALIVSAIASVGCR